MSATYRTVLAVVLVMAVATLIGLGATVAVNRNIDGKVAFAEGASPVPSRYPTSVRLVSLRAESQPVFPLQQLIALILGLVVVFAAVLMMRLGIPEPYRVSQAGPRKGDRNG